MNNRKCENSAPFQEKCEDDSSKNAESGGVEQKAYKVFSNKVRCLPRHHCSWFSLLKYSVKENNGNSIIHYSFSKDD
jgi:hypothetical protein